MHVALLLLALSAPAAAQRVDVVEMPPATLDELARTVVTPRPREREERGRPPLPAMGAANARAAELVPVAAAAPAPPPVTRGFRSASDPPPGTFDLAVPADVSGAVGPHHVVGAYNDHLTVHDRNGTPRALVLMEQFFDDGIHETGLLTDPRVVYDAAYDRWVVVMISDPDGQSALMLAVSATGDPAGTWRRFRVAGHENYGFDFPRMALIADQIVVTVNAFGLDPFGTDIFTIDKTTAFSAGATPSATRTFFPGQFDLTPVDSKDDVPRFLGQDNDAVSLYMGMFPQRVASYASPTPLGHGAIRCKQKGTTVPVDCGEAIVHYALYRDGVLWAAQTANDGTHSRIAVWKIAGGAATMLLLSDPNTDYAYPSIAVNRYGTALLGYAVLSGTIYPSAEYRTIDRSGNVSAAGTVKAGEEWYVFGRWGDYTTTLVDPVDDASFWTLQNYTQSSANHGSWATWWSYIQVTPPPRTRAVRH